MERHPSVIAPFPCARSQVDLGAGGEKLDMKLAQVVRTPEFWLLLFATTCGTGAGLTFIANATDVSKSLHAPDSSDVLVSLLSLGNAAGRLAASVWALKGWGGA